MADQGKIAFVLGSGFTRAFCPTAPILRDGWEEHFRTLEADFKEHKHARRVLEAERARDKEGINLERLMTRLYSGMPYDLSQSAVGELDLLKEQVGHLYVTEIAKIQEPDPEKEEPLSRFAEFCISHEASCVTLNHDDLLDRFLFRVAEQRKGERQGRGRLSSARAG